MTTGYDRLYEALDSRGLIVAGGNGAGVRARCPSHDDKLPSLSISEGDNGFPLAYCHAGCSWHDIIEALGLEGMAHEDAGRTDRIVAQYVYTDEAGKPLYRVSRRDPKGFHQERYEAGAWVLGLRGTRKVLYDLPSVLQAVADGTPIYILEGEKDVETFKATQTGAVATCFVGGAGKWSEEATELLGRSAAEIRIVADRDEAGRKHAAMLLAALAPQRGMVLYPAEGKDFTDHIYAGYVLGELLEHEPIETDWDDWDEAVPDFDWLVPGILARGTLVWAYGPKESAKSMYLLDVCTRLSHAGIACTYYSEEMARTQDKRRIARFAPNRESFRWKNGRGLDLSNEDHVARVCEENRGAGLIILDSYERCFHHAIANENKRAIVFSRIVHEIIVKTGACVVVIDHTGFGFRDDTGHLHEQRAPRGASAKEQQADMSILFSPLGRWRKGEPFRFRIENMKPGRLENPFTQDLEVVDTTDGGLAVVRMGFRTSTSDGDAMDSIPAATAAPSELLQGESTANATGEDLPAPGFDSQHPGNHPGGEKAVRPTKGARSLPASNVEGGSEPLSPTAEDSDKPIPLPPITPEQQRRIRELLRKGKSREDAYSIVAIEKAFGQLGENS